MSSGRQKTVYIRPSRIVGEVEVLAPASFATIIASDSPANIASAMVGLYGGELGFYETQIQKARELRGIEVSVGDAVVSFPAQSLG